MTTWREKKAVTTDPSTIDLDAIEARCRRATQGPWHVAILDEEDTSTYVVNRNPAPGEKEAGTFKAVTIGVVSHDGDYNIEPSRQDADAEFIAHARADLELLLGLVRRIYRQDRLLFSAVVEKALDQYVEDARRQGREEGYARAIAFLEDRERVENWNSAQDVASPVLGRTGREVAARYLTDVAAPDV